MAAQAGDGWTRDSTGTPTLSQSPIQIVHGDITNLLHRLQIPDTNGVILRDGHKVVLEPLHGEPQHTVQVGAHDRAVVSGLDVQAAHIPSGGRAQNLQVIWADANGDHWVVVLWRKTRHRSLIGLPAHSSWT